jgi:uncharacterized protein (UPF0332 family)
VLDKSKLELAKYRFENAKEDYETASDLIKSGHYKGANNRAYYSIFHGMRAVLALEGVDFKKHSGVIAHFNQHYIKTGKIKKEFFKIISEASYIRNESDYNDFYIASKEESDNQLCNAAKFLKAVEFYIEQELELGIE